MLLKHSKPFSFAPWLCCALALALSDLCGEDRIPLTRAEAEEAFARSSHVVAFHWNEDAQDYLVERFKGPLTLGSEWPLLLTYGQTEAGVPERPKVVFLFIPKNSSKLDSSPIITEQYMATSSEGHHLRIVDALELLRGKKRSEKEK